MLLNRLLKYINLLVAVLLCIVLAVVYWFGYRVLPKTSGTIRAPLSAPARVTRDPLGVPHIQASSIEDALFLQGYVTAQDRLFQMELLRRLAAGELSELFGPVAVEADRDARRFRLRRVAEEQAKRLDAKERVWLTAYARGVNYFMETHQDALPMEFTLQRYKPRPWSVVDTLTDRNANVSHADDDVAGRNREDADAAGWRCGDGERSFSDSIRERLSAGLERVGGERKEDRFGETDSGERSAPGVRLAFDLVSGSSSGSGDERCRRFHSRRSERGVRT